MINDTPKPIVFKILFLWYLFVRVRKEWFNLQKYTKTEDSYCIPRNL